VGFDRGEAVKKESRLFEMETVEGISCLRRGEQSKRENHQIQPGNLRRTSVPAA